jgi:hypothetical protein
MLLHGLLVDSVDLRRLGGSAGGNDLLRERFDLRPLAPGEKNLGPLARKLACDSASDGASGTVDHRNLVLEDHDWVLFCARVVTPARLAIRRRPGPVRAVDDADTATSRNWALSPPISRLGRCATQGS